MSDRTGTKQKTGAEPLSSAESEPNQIGLFFCHLGTEPELTGVTVPNRFNKRLTKSYGPSARASKKENVRTKLKASSSRSTNDSHDSGKMQITSSHKFKSDAFHHHPPAAELIFTNNLITKGAFLF